MTAADSRDALPEGPVLTWYGDDLTGSAAVMEVLTLAGLPSVLFLEIPSEEELASYDSFRCIGVAGTARHRDPQWMRDNLPAVFEFLAGMGAPISHYKVCSTFDSDPSIGSIGTAIDLALPVLAGRWTPLVVAAPPIGRYQAFGNLFAAADSTVYRLDRHPTMSAHPVTPMTEADIGRHLGLQTASNIGLIDLRTLKGGNASADIEGFVQEGTSVISLDVVDDSTLLEVGRLMWQHRGERLLAIGSQGVEYALSRYWRERGMVGSRPEGTSIRPAERFAAVSGSVSPITSAQLEWADVNGFDLLRINVERAIDPAKWRAEIDETTERALRVLVDGGSPIVFTALGPDEPAIERLEQRTERSEVSLPDVRNRIGQGLGVLLDRLVTEAGVTRAAVVGGDTSGQVLRAIGARSLTFLKPMGPATSMMTAHLGTTREHTLEVTLKGGQMGAIEFFGTVKDLQGPT